MSAPLEHCVVVFDPFDNRARHRALLDVEEAQHGGRILDHVAGIFEEIREAAEFLGLKDVLVEMIEDAPADHTNSGWLHARAIVVGQRSVEPDGPESVHEELVLAVRAALKARLLEL